MANPWINVDDRKPGDFNLVNIRDSDGRVQRGWWTGHVWDYGKRLIRKPVYQWQEITKGERIKDCRISNDKSSLFFK